jgi:hypothetical protein
MLWFVNSGDPAAEIRTGLTNDETAARALAAGLVPDMTLMPLGQCDLVAASTPAADQIFVGVYRSLAVVTGPILKTSSPSTLPEQWTAALPAQATILLNTDPEFAVGAFARWEDGILRRSFAANPVDIYENIGLPFVFEGPFWAGERPLVYAQGAIPDPQALPFHPQEFAEEAIRTWLGFRITTPRDPSDSDPESILLSGFAIRPQGYQPDQSPPERRPVEEPAGPPAEESSPPPATKRVARWFGFGPKS